MSNEHIETGLPPDGRPMDSTPTAKPVESQADPHLGGEAAPVASRPRNPAGWLTGKTRRTKDLRNVNIAKDHTFGRMTHNKLGEKYKLNPSQIRKILAREEIVALEELWTQNMFNVHRQMGDEALQATYDLILQRDPTTIKDYWHRMGISREPAVEVDVKELRLDVPQPVQDLLTRVFAQLPKPEPVDGT